MYAYCFRSGHIELSEDPDVEGGICIGEGLCRAESQAGWPRPHVLERVWLVSGVPEAETVDAALNATIRFKTRMDELLAEAG